MPPFVILSGDDHIYYGVASIPGPWLGLAVVSRVNRARRIAYAPNVPLVKRVFRLETGFKGDRDEDLLRAMSNRFHSVWQFRDWLYQRQLVIMELPRATDPDLPAGLSTWR
jgi:hypothetical protein